MLLHIVITMVIITFFMEPVHYVSNYRMARYLSLSLSTPIPAQAQVNSNDTSISMFPAVRYLEGYQVLLEPGDLLFGYASIVVSSCRSSRFKVHKSLKYMTVRVKTNLVHTFKFFTSVLYNFC